MIPDFNDIIGWSRKTLIVAICGYNEKIGGGLQLLIEGMIEALEKKAETASVDVVLTQELVELDNMISVLGSGRGEVLPEMFVGLNLLARSMFAQVRNDLRKTGTEDLAASVRSVAVAFDNLLIETEHRSQELRESDRAWTSATSLPRALAEWALSRSREYPVQHATLNPVSDASRSNSAITSSLA